jgi:catalase
MIEHFTLADADYGRRVAEGLQLKIKDQSDKGPIGATSPKEGLETAEQVSHEAKPY